MAFVRVEKEGRVASVVIDRPKALNALNEEVLLELRAEIIKLEGVHVVILSGAGDKAFVAGADIAQMVNFSPLQARAFVELGQGVMQVIEASPFISISAVNGFCLGGGLELALTTDLIYASTTSKFGAPETNLGIVPGFGGTVNLVERVGMHRAMDLILSGRIINAEEAKQIGLVLELFSPEELHTKVKEIAHKLAEKKGLLSLLAGKRLVRQAASNEKEKGLLLERETFATLFASGEAKEGMTAFLEKREPKFQQPT